MALSSRWVTSARRRTGIPAARSCLVRLKTQALAASCTGRFRGWFLIPITTSCSTTFGPTLAAHTSAHRSPRTICLLLEATTVTHSTQLLPPLYLSEKSICCDFSSQGITFPSAQWFKAGNFCFSKSFCTACSNLSKKRLHRLQEIPRKSQAGIKSPSPSRGEWSRPEFLQCNDNDAVPCCLVMSHFKSRPGLLGQDRFFPASSSMMFLGIYVDCDLP